MQTVARSQYLTIKTEGAILPADLLQRLAEGKLDGLKPEQYHLSPNERLNEAITRAWNRCQGVWQSFQEQRQKLAPSESGTSLTRERWLLILFQELGYGRLTFQPGGLEIQPKTDQPILTPTTRYPISHVWEHVPIHLVTFQQKLDTRDPASKRSPHSLMQEFLTRSEDHLWGMVSNGLTLRVLRDNVSLTRAAYLEFDLEAMMSGDNYADFSLLWLVCHQSRFEIRGEGNREWVAGSEDATPDSLPPTPSNCWLEIWSQEAAEQGTRALETLRDGVREAISALGRGFLAHPANTALRQQLTSGTLNKQDYYRQLLRLVYRLIFLFVAEDRDLLLHPEADSTARQRYRDHYSVGRMRRLAGDRRGGPHPDLYRAFRLVCGQLRGGYPALGLPALGSFLFSSRAIPALDGADIANEAWLNAIRALAFTLEGQVRRPVDYKNLGTEELGSVYESLLELHPQLNIAAATFTLDMVSGSERKTTGSYYTPASLINSLLDSALEPVVADRLQTATQHAPRTTPDLEALSQTLLAIRVVDPACGSGHFLIAAARRLARHLARIQTGDDEPGPAAVRHALREVVGHCIYGVDINEMSVELCKVGLWLETLDPGKPLNFLDKNIQCGNSLIGATPALLARGIPDEAFTPITGDDKSYASEYRKQNSKEKGQLRLFGAGMQPWQRLGNLTQALLRLDQIETETLAGVAQQENAYADYIQSGDYAFNKLWADAWCAAFVWRKQGERATPTGFPYPITESVYRQIERNPHTVPGWMRTEIERLAGQYQFLHWHLAFPQVFKPREDLTGSENLTGEDSEDVTGWTGGFDVVLGNPPWDQIQLDDREFFASSAPDIANALNMSVRKRLLDQLKQQNERLYGEYEAAVRQLDGVKHFIHSSQQFPFTSFGRLNLAPLFAELTRHIVRNTGQVGIIVPTGIATDSFNQYFFRDLIDSAALVSLYDFENRAGLFPAVDSRMKFCLLTLTGPTQPAMQGAQFVFFAHGVTDIKNQERLFFLKTQEIALLNPNTFTCPTFRSSRDAEITKSVYLKVNAFVREKTGKEGDPWGATSKLLFMMNTDSILFEQSFMKGYLPLYEGKMIQAYDHRAASVVTTDNIKRPGQPKETLLRQHSSPTFFVTPQYWIPQIELEQRLSAEWNRKWLLSWKKVTSPTNERTLIAGLLPYAGVADSMYTLVPQKQVSAWTIICLYGNLNSIIVDYIARQKVGGVNLNAFHIWQLPILIPDVYNSYYSMLIGLRILELTFTAYDLQPFAQDCGYFGPPFRWDEERRFLLRCELDAAYFHLYGIQRDDVAYIMDTFPIVRRKDEAAYGEYRTKRVILEIYDEMGGGGNREWGVGNRGGIEGVPTPHSLPPTPYQTRLDPPPADPRAAHPWDETYLGPYRDPATWWVTPTATVDDVSINECLDVCALRFDGHAYMENTGLDFWSTLNRLIEEDIWPDNSLDQMALFFGLQRNLGKGGGTYLASNSREWRVFHELFLRLCTVPPPDRYRHPEYAEKWENQFVPELPHWQALVQQRHDQARYSRETVLDEGIVRDAAKKTGTTSVIREPRPVLELTPPPAPTIKGRNKAPGDPTPHSPLPTPLITDITPPKGERNQRLKQVMALTQPKNTAELQTLVAALGDEDESIRWLAGSSLSRLPATTLLPVLRAFIRQSLTPTTQSEVRRVLRLLSDLSDDEGTQAEVGQLLETLTN